MSTRPECPKCGGPEVSVAELRRISKSLMAPAVAARFDEWMSRLKKTDRLLCARCLHGRTGSPDDVSDALDVDLEEENPDDVIRREQAKEAHKRAKFERAMRGEW